MKQDLYALNSSLNYNCPTELHVSSVGLHVSTAVGSVVLYPSGIVVSITDCVTDCCVDYSIAVSL